MLVVHFVFLGNSCAVNGVASVLKKRIIHLLRQQQMLDQKSEVSNVNEFHGSVLSID